MIRVSESMAELLLLGNHVRTAPEFYFFMQFQRLCRHRRVLNEAFQLDPTNVPLTPATNDEPLTT